MSGSLEKMCWEVRVYGVCSAQMIIPYVFFRLEKAICPANCKLTFKDGNHSNSSLNDKTIVIIIKILITLICGNHVQSYPLFIQERTKPRSLSMHLYFDFT